MKTKNELKIFKSNLLRKNRGLLVLNYTNSFVFKIGKFVQKMRYSDPTMVEEMYNYYNNTLSDRSFLISLRDKINKTNDKEELQRISKLTTYLHDYNQMRMKCYYDSLNDVVLNNTFTEPLILRPPYELLNKLNNRQFTKK